MALEDIHLKTFREGVYEALKLAILRYELPPGQRLLERELVTKIGTSRTPIREAIIKLEQEGLVERHNGGGRGYFVSFIHRQEIEEVYSLRKILESYCVSLVIDRIRQEELEQLEQVIREEELSENIGNISALVELDTKFHEILYKASRNSKLCEVLRNLKNQIYRYRTMSFKLRQKRKIALSNHRQLLMAIKKKDKRLAKKLATDTISRSRSILIKELFEGENLTT